MTLGAAIRSYTVDAIRCEEPSPGQRAWRLVLGAAALGYRAGIAVRGWSFATGLRTVRHLPCPVICIGNLTLGGSGKTPCTIALAQWFHARDRAVGLLLRGYGRRDSRVAIAADDQQIRAGHTAVGDEAVLLARRLPGVPVVVGSNRFLAGQEALRRFRLDVLLLDDGFQHRQLHRDLDLVMVDATDPFGGGRLFPRGRLREPMAELRRAHAVVLSRTDQAADLSGLRRQLEEVAPEVPKILTRHRPSRLTDLAQGEARPPDFLRGRRVLAVSGIANPEGFHRTLTDLGGMLVGALAFPDHHPYGPPDLLRVNRAAQEVEAEVMVTTEKDAVRMPALGEAGIPCQHALSLGIDLEVTEGAESLDRLLSRCLGTVHGSGDPSRLSLGESHGQAG